MCTSLCQFKDGADISAPVWCCTYLISLKERMSHTPKQTNTTTVPTFLRMPGYNQGHMKGITARSRLSGTSSSGLACAAKKRIVLTDNCFMCFLFTPNWLNYNKGFTNDHILLYSAPAEECGHKQPLQGNVSELKMEMLCCSQAFSQKCNQKRENPQPLTLLSKNTSIFNVSEKRKS